MARLEKTVARRIAQKLTAYAAEADPLKHAKRLKGDLKDYLRFRVGDYRAIFKADPKTDSLVILVVLKVVHRKEAY